VDGVPLKQWSLPPTGVQFSGIYDDALVAKSYGKSLPEFYEYSVEDRELMIATVHSEQHLTAVLEERARKQRKP
jgi:uncharacterized circularly permuted ATP-grasp superfamily protein